jgi:hypothetical protein
MTFPRLLPGTHGSQPKTRQVLKPAGFIVSGASTIPGGAVNEIKCLLLRFRRDKVA